MFMGYWDTNIAMLFLLLKKEEYWDSKLNNSDSFKGQVIHYFKTINFLLIFMINILIKRYSYSVVLEK